MVLFAAVKTPVLTSTTAHEEQDNNKVVKTWVKQVHDSAYDVEDSL